MKIIDVNLLIYAINQDAPAHGKAKKWLESVLTGTETIALPWIVLLAFLRLTTRPGLFQKPLPVAAAFDIMDAWLHQPSVLILDPTPNHLRTMRALLNPLGTAGNLTSDAHLAALAIEHNAELCSTDNDFSRFPRLRWTNPLAG